VEVLVNHSTGEGGEPRSKGPAGGKGRPDMTDCWGEPWEALEATNPVTATPADSGASCGRQRILVKPHLLDSESSWHTMDGTEEPDESITHVRVCGGAG
jgi:hypothetical protein